MKPKFIKWKNVEAFCDNDHLKNKAFKQFYQRAKYSDWNKPKDIIETFGKADLVTCKNGRPRIVFNIARNRFRLVCGYSFRIKTVNLYIKFVGTHKDYDAIDVCKVDMFKSN
jgi:mRNA interferase HigB